TITAAVADATALAAPLVQSGEEGKKVEPSDGTTEHVEGEDKPPVGDANNQPKANETAKPVPAVRLRTGQQIVIPGSKTPIYIPPTGIEVVPDTSIDDSGRPVTPNMARQLLEKFERQSADAAATKGSSAQRGGPSYATTGIEPAVIIGRLQKKVQAGELDVLGLKAMLPTDQASMFLKNVQRARESSYTDQNAIKYALEQLPTPTLTRMVESAKLFEEPDLNLQEGTISGVAVDDLKLIAEAFGTPSRGPGPN
ncbi:MAG: hypothetical protein WC786_01860, partial [Patescibacteria group bacterium]